MVIIARQSNKIKRAMHGFIDNVHGYQVLDPYIQRLLGTMVEREPV